MLRTPHPYKDLLSYVLASSSLSTLGFVGIRKRKLSTTDVRKSDQFLTACQHRELRNRELSCGDINYTLLVIITMVTDYYEVFSSLSSSTQSFVNDDD